MPSSFFGPQASQILRRARPGQSGQLGQLAQAARQIGPGFSPAAAGQLGLPPGGFNFAGGGPMGPGGMVPPPTLQIQGGGAPPPAGGGTSRLGPQIGSPSGQNSNTNPFPTTGGSPAMNARNNPMWRGKNKGARRALEMGEQMLGPEAISYDTNKLMSLLTSSPAFAAMMKNALSQGSMANTAIQGNLARTGLSGSGVGAAIGGLAPTIGANAAMGVRGQMFQDAMNTSLQSLLARYQGLPGVAGGLYGMGQPSTGERIGMGLLGAAGQAVGMRR